jgi:hypothetical protein
MDVLQAAQPIEGSQIDFILKQEGPRVMPLRPYPDCHLGRMRDGRVEVDQLEEPEVEVLVAVSRTSSLPSAPPESYRRALCHLADVNRVRFALDVQREEGIGELVLERILNSLLPCGRAGIGKVGAPPSRSRRSKVFGGEGVVELRRIAHRLELCGTLIEGGIVNGLAAGPRETQIPQRDTAKVSQFAVLR